MERQNTATHLPLLQVCVCECVWGGGGNLDPAAAAAASAALPPLPLHTSITFWNISGPLNMTSTWSVISSGCDVNSASSSSLNDPQTLTWSAATCVTWASGTWSWRCCCAVAGTLTRTLRMTLKTWIWILMSLRNWTVSRIANCVDPWSRTATLSGNVDSYLGNPPKPSHFSSYHPSHHSCHHLRRHSRCHTWRDHHHLPLHHHHRRRHL